MFNFRSTITVLAVVLMAVLNAACSPTDGDPTQVKMSHLIGLWNSSEKLGSKTDVIYTRITSGGEIVEYDFDGDEVDRGLSCYQIITGAIKNIEANRFLVSVDMHVKEQFEVELELLDAGHALKVYFLDDSDPAKTVKSQIWTRVSDETMLDDEPSCRNN